MVYKYVSSKNILYAIYDLGMKSSDWEGRLPNWIYKAVKDLNCYRTLYDSSVPVEITDC